MTVSVSQVVAALEGAGVAVGPVIPADGGAERVKVTGVQQDSRRIGPGDLFVAWSGAVHDAHDHVAGAAAAGAAAAIVERPVAGASLPQIQVDNARLAAAVATGFVTGSPWRDISVVGVTGTNGKTTTAMMARSVLARAAPSAAGVSAVRDGEQGNGPRTDKRDAVPAVRGAALSASTCAAGWATGWGRLAWCGLRRG